MYLLVLFYEEKEGKWKESLHQKLPRSSEGRTFL